MRVKDFNVVGKPLEGRSAAGLASPSCVIQMKKFTLRRALLLAFFLIVIIALAAVFFAREDLYAMFSALGELGYLGIFLLSFIGAASIIIPIPYTVVLITVSASGQFDPLLLAIAAGVGAAIGELVGYGVGYAGRKVMSKKYDRRFNAMLRIFDRFGMPAVFIFALTPLPDDLLFIPLGLMRYSLWKVFIPCVTGKFLMSLIITHVGAAAGAELVIAVITTILLILVVVAMFRINWEKLVEKYLPQKD